MKSDGFHEELIMSSLLGSPSLAHFWLSDLHLSCPIYAGYYAYRQRYCGTDDRLKPDKVGIIDFGGGFAAKSSGTFGITNISALVYWF